MKKIVLFLSVLISIIINSCAPVYVPTTHAAPMLENKGEVHTSIYTGTNGFNGQFAYAPTENIGVQINGLYLNDKEEHNDNEHDRKTVYGEVAFGRYGKLNNFFRVESYLGAGHGWSKAWKGFNLFSDADEGYYVKGYFNKYFATTSFAFTTAILDVGLGAKLSYVDFYKLVNERTNDNFGTSRTIYFAEPSIFTRLGHGLIKYEMMLGFSIPVDKKPNFDYDPFYISMGIHLNWGAVKEKK